MFAVRNIVLAVCPLAIMHRSLDLKLFIPVICNEKGKYVGKRYLERISSVRMLNGNPVDKELQKSEFKTGDMVSIHFGGKDYLGTVDFSEDEASLNEQGDSPCTVLSLPYEMADNPDSSRPKRKKRHRSWEGALLVPQDTTATTKDDEYQPNKQVSKEPWSRNTRPAAGKGKGKERKPGKVCGPWAALVQLRSHALYSIVHMYVYTCNSCTTFCIVSFPQRSGNETTYCQC